VPKVESPKNDPERTKAEVKLSYDEQKEQKRIMTQLTNQLKKCEEKIEGLEYRIKELDELVAALDYSDEKKAETVLNDYNLAKSELDLEMTKWEEITEKILELN
jgi:ATP-binding cassette, subfamily F, member 3